LSVSAARNPTPGIIINHPKGKDVYGGVVIDYKGEVSCAKPIIKCFCYESEVTVGCKITVYL